MSAFWWPSWLRRPEPKPVSVTLHVKADIDWREVTEAVRQQMLAYRRRNGGPEGNAMGGA